ncbi:MAG: hypothetical protein J1F27_07275 [Prevotellaceae bacterium]|nr:hypothetical protein [Prevotellaceae bacterium]
MKKLFLSLVLSVAVLASAHAMSFSRAQSEALYLTDKMAYELNLNDQQYNDAYEINLDYFLRMESPSDVYGRYYDYRLSDLRCILHDWQYSLLLAADYFLRPLAWRAGGWFFPIYSYYNRGSFFYSRPRVWATYHGGHSRFHHSAGFYVNRRPVWSGGLRGHDMSRPGQGAAHRPAAASHNGAGRGGSVQAGSGRGYSFDINGRQGGMNRQLQGGSNSGGAASGRQGGNISNSNASSGMRGSSRNGIGSGSSAIGGSRGSGSSNGSAVRGGTRAPSASSGRGNSFDGSSSRISGGAQAGSSRSGRR